MGSAKVLHPGILTSIQDEGRLGLSFYAIPSSGVMDRSASRLANSLLGNSMNSPVLECTLQAPSLEFQSKAAICLTGSDANWRVNDYSVPLNSVLILLPGDVLKGNFMQHGMRAYIGVKGELNGEERFGSKATYLSAGIGGYKGRALKKGDVLKWRNNSTYSTKSINNIHSTHSTHSTHSINSTNSTNSTFSILPGPEFPTLTSKSQQQLFGSYTISPKSDRMGLRLIGPKLKCKPRKLKASVPVFPGCIQLPPDGQPIILLRDAQVTGGYPRIGYITAQELDRIAQVKLGGEVQFIQSINP